VSAFFSFLRSPHSAARLTTDADCLVLHYLGEAIGESVLMCEWFSSEKSRAVEEAGRKLGYAALPD
jgi:hypothetical protein